MANRLNLKRIAAVLGIIILVLSIASVGFAFADAADGAKDDGQAVEQVQEEQTVDNTIGMKAIGVGIAIGIAAGGGGIGMGIAGARASEGIARQPEAEGKIRTNFMLGLVFIETAIIYALLAVILIIFVL
ncbi:MAG: ATP synthase F0 subunit C [Clostridiales bacterium]|nr:ATP synthase F0 subunit C [Candidatus Crickella caballi]